MTSEAKMSTEADSLRRSKRNKFHLDVASMHLAHPERRRAQPGYLTPSPEVPSRRASSLSPAIADAPLTIDEKSRRVRRNPVRNASYIFDDSDDDECRRGLEGTNLCVKCPARFETRPGLANHFKLHFGEKRKFACELCDFSATTLKSLRFHRRVHDRFGVGPATLSCTTENSISIEDLHCETPTELCLNSSPPQLSPPAIYTVNIPRSQTEPGLLSTLTSHSASPSPLCRRSIAAPPMTPPPNLVRAMSNSTTLNRAFNEKPRECMLCPYKAKTLDRMKNHLVGHQKRTGFQCPFCTFKSESAGFLKRHVEIHGSKSYAWPPVYVGASPDRTTSVIKRRAHFRSTMKVLFLRCALKHPPVGSPTRWPCPVEGCTYSAALVSQHVVHHIQCHVPEKLRRLPRYTCLRCGVCLRNATSLRIHRIIRHVRRHHSKALQYFMRERVGFGYVRCFKNSISEIGKVEAKEEPSEDCWGSKLVAIPTEPSSMDLGRSSSIAQTLPIIADKSSSQIGEGVKINEFCCTHCPYSTSTRSNLIRHEGKHQVKDLFQCPHCSFSGRSPEFIEKHRRLHQTISSIKSSSANPSSQPLHMQPMVLVPMSTVNKSLIALPSVTSVLTVSLPTIPASIAVPSNTELPIAFASLLQDKPVLPSPLKANTSVEPKPPIRSQLISPTYMEQKPLIQSPISLPTCMEQKPCVNQKLKFPPRRSSTEPSLRFIGSDGVKRRRCPLCPYVSKFSCDMRSHMDMHSLNARFKCSQCSYSTKRAVSLRSHIALHTEDNAHKAKSGKSINIVVLKTLIGVKRGRGAWGFYTCSHCPFVTKICAELWRHARRHMGASERYNCSLCSFSSISLEVMEEHQLLHPEGVAFIRELIQRAIHNFNSQYGCPGPKGGLTYNSGTSNSSQQTAVDENCLSAVVQQSSVELKCDVCPFKTTIYQRMWNHRQKHKKTSKFVCSKCTFSTGSETCLEDHMVVHSEPGSGMDTGTVPSRSQSADGNQKLGNDEAETSDSQKSSALEDSVASIEEVPISPDEVEVKPSNSDTKIPLSVGVEAALTMMRPTKEVLPVLKYDRQAQDRRQCPDCPFVESDELIYKLHREMHGGRTRAFACNLCNYSCYAPEALHRHLSLHLPSLSPASVLAQRKRGLGRRSFQVSDAIPLGSKHFSCTQCSFRTVSEANFVQHRQQHAQHIQQRLVTQMKRAASQVEEDSRRYAKMKRIAKKSDKNHACIRCAFRCDTAVAFSRHLEMHKQNAVFKCRLCDYSANTKNIVDFHEQNHHIDQSLTQLRRNAILAPDIVQLDVAASDEERARIAGQELRCKRCSFHTLEMLAFTKHWEQNHCETKADREFAADLRMNLVPASSILTTA